MFDLQAALIHCADRKGSYEYGARLFRGDVLTITYPWFRGTTYPPVHACTTFDDLAPSVSGAGLLGSDSSEDSCTRSRPDPQGPSNRRCPAPCNGPFLELAWKL